MRVFGKILIVGIVSLISLCVKAEDYRVLTLPDNIVTESAALDSYIYDSTAEFFADNVVNLLNKTDFIKSPNISTVRQNFKSNPTDYKNAKALTEKYKTTYNADYDLAKKLAQKTNNRYVLLITSYIDSQNYIMRRTLWDFLNIAGSMNVDPAYKISTYAILIDTDRDLKLWSDTYYKTISVCEERIITRGASPQTEQLQKIKDYSNYICPQIAQSVQANILPPEVFARESYQINYDMSNIDNVFTKKYRHVRKQSGKLCRQVKNGTSNFAESRRIRRADRAAIRKQKRLEKLEQKELKAIERQTELNVKAQPVSETPQNNISNINNKGANGEVNDGINNGTNDVVNNGTNDAVYRIDTFEDDGFYIDIKRKRKNNLYGDYDICKPILRE